MTPTAPATTTRLVWCPTRPRKPLTSRSKRPAAHYVTQKPSATVTYCPHHDRPPPSPTSAKPSTPPTPSTPAPHSPCATASNPTHDRTPITKLCRESWATQTIERKNV